ncbi:hypothetical protein B0H12DRAFT_1231357 [Mycena haematopus]|nr:hypothetical protein B0H12DRAFT_1231357 [Mycena haematopus]
MLPILSPSDAKYTIPRLTDIDRILDNSILQFALPSDAQIRLFDISIQNHTLRTMDWQACEDTAFHRPLLSSDVKEYFHAGVRCGEMDGRVGASLWNSIEMVTNFILCAAQNPTVSLNELTTTIPNASLRAVRSSHPQIVTMKRHSGENGFFSRANIPFDEVIDLYYRLQYAGKIALSWINFTAEHCIFRDAFHKWDWGRWGTVAPPTTEDNCALKTALLGVARAATKLKNDYFNAIDAGTNMLPRPESNAERSTIAAVSGTLRATPNMPQIWSYPLANECRDMVLHPEYSFYCQAHPQFNPFAIAYDPYNPIDATYRNTERRLQVSHAPHSIDYPLTPANSPASGSPVLAATCLAGYSRADQHPAFVPSQLPNTDVEMSDSEASDTSSGFYTMQITDEDMAGWMENLRLVNTSVGHTKLSGHVTEEKSQILRLIRADTGIADTFLAIEEVDVEYRVDYLRSELQP